MVDKKNKKKKKNKGLSVAIALSVVAVFVAVDAPWSAGQEREGEDNRHCRLGGTWIGSFDGGRFTATAIPTRRGAQLVVQPIDGVDDTLGGLFPGAKASASGLRAEVLPVGHNRWLVRGLAYGVQDGELAYIRLDEGMLEANGCDTLETTLDISFFLAEQDANADGFPDNGEEPLFTVAGSSILRRLRAD